MSAQITYESKKPSHQLIVTDTFGFGLISPTERDPDTLADVTYEVMQMLGAVDWLQRELKDRNEPNRERNETAVTQSVGMALHSLIVEVSRLRRFLPKFAHCISDHRPNIPAFAGFVAESYHGVALKLCERVRSWLMQFVILTKADTQEKREEKREWQDAKNFADRIASRLQVACEHWPFPEFNVGELAQYVRLECDRANPRNDKPQAMTEWDKLKSLETRLKGKTRGVFQQLAKGDWKVPLRNLTACWDRAKARIQSEIEKAGLPFHARQFDSNAIIELKPKKRKSAAKKQ
jgi:hypothetical protein